MADNFVIKEKFEYYETHLYNPVIAQSILQYESSNKTSEDQEKILKVLEFVTLKGFYARSCLDVIASEQNNPPTTKISDLLFCIESILQRKYSEIDEYLNKYVESPSLIDKKTHELTLRMYDSYFERVTSCMVKLTQSYRDWNFCGIPMKIFGYLAFFSTSVQLNLLFHQMLRNLLNHLTSIKPEDAMFSHSVSYFIGGYTSFSDPMRYFIFKSNLSGPDLIDMFKKLKSEKSLKEFIQRVLSFSEIQSREKYFIEQRQRLIDDLDKVICDERLVFRASLDWIWTKFRDSAEIPKNGLIEIAGIFHLIRLIKDDSMCAEAIMSLLYTQRLINGYYELYSVKQGQNIAALQQVPNWGIQETKKAFELAQDPTSVTTDSFRYIIDGLMSINTVNCITSDLFQERSEDNLVEVNKTVQPLFDLWFSPDSGLIYLLLKKLRESHKSIQNSEIDSLVNRKNVRDLYDCSYLDTIFTLLKICNDLNTQKTATIRAEGGFIIKKYDYIIPEMVKFIDEECFDALNSKLESNQLIFWSKLAFYGFKWRQIRQDIPGFCQFAIKTAESIINDQILRLKEILSAAYFAEKTVRGDLTLLSYHSMAVTGILLVICSNEIVETELKTQFLKNLKIDEVLKFFEELKAWLAMEQQGNELLFQIACYYYAFYFGTCSNIQCAKLQADNNDLMLSIPQFKKLLELAVAFSDPNLRFADLFSQLPVQMTRVGKEKPDYLRALHSSGFVNFLYEDVLFNFDTIDLIRLDSQTDFETRQDIRFDQLKAYLYEQLIEDANFDQVSQIITINLEKLTQNSELLKGKLLNFQKIRLVDKFRCITYFWVICLDLKTFLKVLEDLFEQAKAKHFTEDARAQPLMSTLQGSLICALNILMSLPIASRDPAIAAILTRILNQVSVECVESCYMSIRTTLLSLLCAENSLVLVSDFILVPPELTQNSKDFKFYKSLVPIMAKEMSTEALSFHFKLEALCSLLDSLDANLSHKLPSSISSEELQTLRRIWISFHTEVFNHVLIPNKFLRLMLDKYSKYYFKFFEFCYDSSHKQLLAFFLSHVRNAIQLTRKLESDSEFEELKKVWMLLSVGNGVLSNFVLYYLQQISKLTDNHAEIIRDILGCEGVISTIMEAFAAMCRLSSLVLNHKDKDTAKETTRQVGLAYDEMTNFLSVIVEKQILSQSFVPRIFTDLSKQGGFDKKLDTFFKELLAGLKYIAQIEPELHQHDSEGEISMIYQQFVNFFLRVAQESIDLIFFSPFESLSKKEMLDFFNANVFKLLWRLSKRVCSVASHRAITALAGYSTLSEDALKIIHSEINSYKDTFGKLANEELQTLKEMLGAEIANSHDPKLAGAQTSFSSMIWGLVASYIHISGILASNIDELADQCSSLAETNIKICNKLFDTFQGMNVEEINNFMKSQLHGSYDLLCRHPLKAVINAGPIFQKLRRNEESEEIRKAVEELYRLCTALLKLEEKAEMFTLKSPEDELMVLLNLLALFEYYPSKLEALLKDFEGIAVRIVDQAVNPDTSFPLLYLLIKTLTSDINMKEGIMMHLTSVGLKRMDTQSYSGDLNMNLFKVFHQEDLDELQKKILRCSQGKWKVSSSYSLKDAPYVDPEQFVINKQGEKIFRDFLSTIESSFTTTSHLRSLTSVLACLIMVYPRIVIQLTKNSSNNSHPASHPNGDKDQKETFLYELLQAFLESNEQVAFEILIDALINPQMQSELVLYRGEVMPTVTYHRYLLTDWLIKNFEKLDFERLQDEFDKKMGMLIPAVKIIFRDAHLLSLQDIKLYYTILDQVLSVCVRSMERAASPSGAHMMTTDIACCLEPLRDIQLVFMVSEPLNLNPTELLYNFNFVLAKKLQDFMYSKMTSKQLFQSSVDNQHLIEEKKVDETFPINFLTEKHDSKSRSLKYGAYNLSKLFFESMLVNGYLLNERIKQKSGLYLFNKEIRFLLSKMPVELLDFSSLSESTSNVESHCHDEEFQKKLQLATQFLDGIRKELKNFVVAKEKTSAGASFTVDFELKDLIPGEHAPHEIIELAQNVNTRFRKFLGPIFVKTFISHLQNRRIYWNLNAKDLESEAKRFITTLSKKEYIAFMLFTDEDTFREQPKQIQTVLQGLREKAKSLLAQKESYENIQGRNRTLVSKLDDTLTPKTKLEKLLSTEWCAKTNPNEVDFLSKLECLLTGKLNHNVSSVLKSILYNIESKTMRLESTRMSKHSLQILGLINNYYDKIASKRTSSTFPPVPSLPGSLLEKILIICCQSILDSGSLAEILKVFTFNPYDEIRMLDLFQHVLSIPDENMHLFQKLIEDSFKIKLKKGHTEVSEGIKTALNTLLTKLFAYRSREIIFLADFKSMIANIEKELGVIPLKKELMSTGLMKFQYTPGRSFVQEWRLTISSKLKSKPDGCGQTGIPLLIQYFNNLSASIVEEEDPVKKFSGLFDDPAHFSSNSYTISDMHFYLALKNPRVIEMILQLCNSSKSYDEKITLLSQFADKLNDHLKQCIKNNGLLCLQGLDTNELIHHIDDIRFFTSICVLCIQYFQEVIDRLGTPKFIYTETQRFSIICCNKQLKSFLEHPVLNKLQNNFVGHLEKLEQILESGASPELEEGSGLELINAICSYVITFYKIHKVQEELEYVITMGQEEVSSPALVKIKSKGEKKIEEPRLRLDRSFSVAYTEMAFCLDEVMFRLASKCAKLFKLFINYKTRDYFLITMAPWVIPQSVRLEFLRDVLQPVNENSIIKKFYLRRDSILEDTLSNFDALAPTELNYELKLNIEFIGEAGVDQGGLTTEWISKLLKILLDPAAGLFHLSPNNISLQPSPSSAIIPENHKYYRLVGRLIGYVIANRIAVNVNFTKPMLKQILGVPLNAFDIADVDPDLSNSLQWMLHNKVNPEEIMQEFSFEFNFMDNYYTIDLTKDQSNQEVSEENKRLFVKLLIYQKLVKSIEIPLSEIYAGITEFVPSLFLKMLTPVDLNSILAGESTINVAEMKQYAKINEPAPSPEVVEWLWEILEEMEKDQLSAFLFFVTGNSVVGFGGFKEHPIIINRSFLPNGSLPSVHTCFSMIDLPEYYAKEIMKEKLLKAIYEGQGFYLA